MKYVEKGFGEMSSLMFRAYKGKTQKVQRHLRTNKNPGGLKLGKKQWENRRKGQPMEEWEDKYDSTCLFIFGVVFMFGLFLHG